MEHVLSRWADSLEMSRADEMGRRGQIWRTGSSGRFCVKNTPHFHGSWPVRKISPRRPISSARGVTRLPPHLESPLSTLTMSDQTLGRARGGADRYCMTYPGTAVGVNTGVNTYATGQTYCLIGHRERGECSLLMGWQTGNVLSRRNGPTLSRSEEHGLITFWHNGVY